MSELAHYPPRQLLLCDERRLAANLAIALGVVKLEKKIALSLERRGAAIEYDLVVADARGQLTKSEREPCRERTLAKRNELGGRMDEFTDRAAGHAPSAHAEQTLGRRVHLRDQQAVVEHDDCGRKALEDLARVGGSAWSSQTTEVESPGRRPRRMGRGRDECGV